MRSILELCVQMDTLAQANYEIMAASCTDPQLAQVFTRMAVEEQHHTTWWNDLIDAWDKGLVPDIVNDTQGLERHMQALYLEMQTTLPDDFKTATDDDMLDLAVRLEFFMLDPIFGELLDLTEPGGAGKHQEAYGRHLERIVGAIEMFYSRGELARFLARMLRRVWRDNLALASFASRDALTGLYNRRGLMTHLNQWLSWARRYDRPLGLLLIDVDDFKDVNDSFGHTVGDQALRTVSRALEAAVRGSDLVARYGGDEFAVVAPETDADELSVLAERLVKAASDANLSNWDGERVSLSISVGGSVVTMPGLEGTAVDGLLAAADRSLYAAKRAGKGRAGDMLPYQAGEPVEG